MIQALAIILLGESFATVGHVLYKKNANKLNVEQLKSVNAYFMFVKRVLQLPEIWLGFLATAAGLICWLAALSRLNLSFAFSASSILYVLTLFASKIFLNEKIDASKLTGTFLIIIGIITIGLS